MNRLVVGTKAWQDPDWFRTMCAQYPHQLALGLDARNGFVATDGWLQTTSMKATDLARQFERIIDEQLDSRRQSLRSPASDVKVYSAFPHMHLLGKRIALTQVGGPSMIEIPRWDFHWQNAYHFVEPPILRPTDSVQVDCEYDNSFANQPVVMGQKQPPRDVRWGETSLDEMCVVLLTVSAVK